MHPRPPACRIMYRAVIWSHGRKAPQLNLHPFLFEAQPAAGLFLWSACRSSDWYFCDRSIGFSFGGRYFRTNRIDKIHVSYGL